MEDVTALHVPEALPRPAEVPVAVARPRKRFRLHPALDAILKAAALFLIAQFWVVQGYRVFGSCMEPNLTTGERLLGSKLALVGGIHRGDVVVFQPPHKPHTAFIKRIVGLPGEIIEIKNNRVYVNNKPLNEPYLHLSWHDERAAERIPDDKVYVLGDNRDNSNDSRIWGELPIESIQAKAWFRYWPLDRMGVIE